MSGYPADWLWNNVKYPFPAIDFRPGGIDEHGLAVPRALFEPEPLPVHFGMLDGDCD